ncbi:MAG TPA: hypothetical protein VH042_08185 [Solirubrobacterales bacterium]|nr:hypothetical protein [Solirubrobacterales bacterium]
MAFCGGVANAAPKLTGPAATSVNGTSAILKGTVSPEGSETNWRFLWGTADCSVKPSPCKSTAKKATGSGTKPVAAEALLVNLTPGTVYHFLLEAESEGGEVKVQSTDRAFFTQGTPAEGLPDERVYEQASPVNKDGGDALGALGLTKAAADGDGITFGSTFGIPGGKGAQAFPSYLALRGEGEAGWSTQGLLPPPSFGERAQVQGWTPDFSKTYAEVQKLGNPRTKALIEQSTSGGPVTTVSAYTPKAEYSYVGASADDSIVLFESQAQLPTKETGGTLITAAVPGRPNLYAWSRATGEVSLAGVLNTGKAPAKGSLAGPYAWSRGISANTLRTGGSAIGYYLQGPHAISDNGDVYFTEVGTGQLYQRINPTQPQSPMEGEKCKDPAKACTIHVSASKRGTPDPAGPQPAAFQVASTDGSTAFFTSPEKLTAQSNTGPEQPEAAIGVGSSETKKTIENEALVKHHAIGVAVQGSHLYWADPTTGAIGRYNLDGSGEDPAFIPIGTGECELEVEPEVVKSVEIPSSPRYVTVDETGKYIYWTNSGLRDGEGVPIDGGGTIGRAELGPSGELLNVEPEFICGEAEPNPGERTVAVSNPQGIAVNASHLYWANVGSKHNGSIARAELSPIGEVLKVEPEFISPPKIPPTGVLQGLALSSSHLYFGLELHGSLITSYIGQATLEGEELSEIFVDLGRIRGVTTDGTNLYWAMQEKNTIGRIPLAEIDLQNCPVVPSCDPEFVKLAGTPNGVAVDSAKHLYWSINGEAPINPGNDLYRFKAAGEALEDLTYVAAGDGAEVQGVLGASADGSRVYFAANADLDAAGPAKEGNCHTPSPHGSTGQISGSCEVYLWQEGTISAVGRVRGPDAIDWVGTPFEVFSHFVPKSAFVSHDGKTLLFRSEEKLTSYENEGAPELYRFRIGDSALRCVSCPPTGEAPGKGPTVGTIDFPGPALLPLRFSVAMLESRNFSADGDRAFFETAEALLPSDTNGQGGCPGVGVFLIPACQDVYEWEAPGTGSCTSGAPGYSPLNEGCVYLISSGKSPYPSYFSDASESGKDAFFFTRQGLVGQDKDELQDVYDAKVEGGIAAQNQVPQQPCGSTEACKGPYSPAPTETTPGTSTFVGPANPAPKHKKQAKKHKQKAKKHKKSKAKAKRGAGR